MAKLGTYCGNCCFYNNKEKSCDHNLLNVFQKRNANITWSDDGPTIDRICAYRRDKKWEIEKSHEEKIITVKNEVYIGGTILIISYDKESLRKTVEKLNSPEINISRFKVIVLYKNIKFNDLLGICGNLLNIPYKCQMMVNESLEYQIYSSLKFAKNGMLFIIESEKEFDIKMFDKVNTMINQKMFRVLHISNDSELHCSVSMVHIYKYLKGDLGHTISYKLKDIAKEENTDPQVLTWKDVDEEYSN